MPFFSKFPQIRTKAVKRFRANYIHQIVPFWIYSTTMDLGNIHNSTIVDFAMRYEKTPEERASLSEIIKSSRDSSLADVAGCSELMQRPA